MAFTVSVAVTETAAGILAVNNGRRVGIADSSANDNGQATTDDINDGNESHNHSIDPPESNPNPNDPPCVADHGHPSNRPNSASATTAITGSRVTTVRETPCGIDRESSSCILLIPLPSVSGMSSRREGLAELASHYRPVTVPGLTMAASESVSRFLDESISPGDLCVGAAGTVFLVGVPVVTGSVGSGSSFAVLYHNVNPLGYALVFVTMAVSVRFVPSTRRPSLSGWVRQRDGRLRPDRPINTIAQGAYSR